MVYMHKVCGHRDIISPTALLDARLSLSCKDDGDSDV